MIASKLIRVIFVAFSVVVGANVVNSFTPSDSEPVVGYDDSLGRIASEAAEYSAQSTDVKMVGTSYYPPIEKDVTFWCTKPNSGVFTQVLLNDTNLADNFDLTKPLAFIVHGWVSTFRGGFLNNFTEENGWMELLANELIKLQITTPNDLTIIGHSFGAHIAGRVGANLNGTIKAIYGLDPAGPIITKPTLTDIAFRLDPTDAQYVQALHTSALVLGSNVNLGHTDIYANGGTLQPGCLLPLLDITSRFGPIPAACDHYASVAFFTTSCNPMYKFVTTSSKSTGHHIDQSVHDLLGPFGLGIYGQFDLTTQENFPYTTTVST